MRSTVCRISQVSLAALCALGCGLVLAVVGATPALGVGDANRTSCPGVTEASSGFRAYLPDCRAYEMVSPPYKEGAYVSSEVFSEAEVAGGAPLVTGRSLGAFGGDPNTPSLFNDYEFVRGAGGWQTVPVDPSPSEYVANPTLATTSAAFLVAGSGDALMLLRRPSESVWASNAYVVDPGSTPKLIGPMLPPSTIPPGSQGSPYDALQLPLALGGATEDLTHFLYYIRHGRPDTWPGDTTLSDQPTEIASSLYEYVGGGHSGSAGDAPKLVGVSDGSTVVNGVALPAGALISQCGVWLGGTAKVAGDGTVGQNAISRDGETVFFTATEGGCIGTGEDAGAVGSGPSANEIFARVGGEKTVAISEPTSSDCAQCEESTPMDAAFDGASRDGSRVFFSTEQHLLPGAEGVSIFEYDFDAEEGNRVSLVAANIGSGGITALSADGSRLYYVSNGAGPDDLLVAHFTCPEGGVDCLAPVEHASFIATLSSLDAAEWSSNWESRPNMNLTPDGTHLVFTSHMDLPGGGKTFTTQQVYLYDAVSGELRRVSIGAKGYNHNGEVEERTSGIPTAQLGNQLRSAQRVGDGLDQHPAISDDGSVVVFESTVALTPLAVEHEEEIEGNPVWTTNLYEYRDGEVFLISDGRSSANIENLRGSRLLGVSASGRDLLFTTVGRLVSQDQDEQADVYDAREGGGFVEEAPPRCEGEECQGSQRSSPVFGAPASATLTGEGNLVSPPALVAPAKAVAPKKKAVRCPRGKRRSRGRCVKVRAGKSNRRQRSRS
jgi:hypothetical protein